MAHFRWPNRSHYLLSQSLKFLQPDLACSLLRLSWFLKILQGLAFWSAGFIGEWCQYCRWLFPELLKSRIWTPQCFYLAKWKYVIRTRCVSGRDTNLVSVKFLQCKFPSAAGRIFWMRPELPTLTHIYFVLKFRLFNFSFKEVSWKAICFRVKWPCIFPSLIFQGTKAAWPPAIRRERLHCGDFRSLKLFGFPHVSYGLIVT